MYSASDYYKSAWFGLKNKIVNIDVPIVLGILVLFFRSVYEIATNYGPGYFDTLCGLLFFMLLGKIFQRELILHFRMIEITNLFIQLR